MSAGSQACVLTAPNRHDAPSPPRQQAARLRNVLYVRGDSALRLFQNGSFKLERFPYFVLKETSLVGAGRLAETAASLSHTENKFNPTKVLL